ncbi:MAG: diguanylate cyclase [Actinomycetota bacterium]|nr:diguanylate cyclase [Actinomycetota bacterium]
MAHLDMFNVNLGGDINFLALYILFAVYLVYSIISYFSHETLSLSGSLSWLAAMLDVFSLCAAIYICGGVQSYTYLFLGLVPLIGGIYGGYGGASYACLLSLIGFTCIVIFDRSYPAGYNVAQAVAVRYAYIVGSAIMDIYIVDLLLRDRKRLRVFYEISQSSSKSPALYNVLKEVTQRMAEVLKAEVAVVFLYNEENGILEAQLPTLGLDYLSTTRLRMHKESSGVLEQSFRDSASVLVSRRRIGLMDIEPFAPDYKIFDLVACPLVARGKNIGLIVLANKLSRRGFTRRDLILTELMSPHISIFLDNALLYRRSEEKVAQLTSLIRVVDAIGTVSSLDQLYNLALDVIRGLFAVEKALINIINPQTGLLDAVRSLGFSEEYITNHFDRPFERIDDCYVLKNDSTFLSPDISNDNRCPNLVVDPGTRSVLCVPIRSGKKVYGILHMASHYVGAFDEEDAILANAIGEQIGMAVESAQLFEEINRLAITDGLTGLYNIRHLKRVMGEEVKRSLRYKRPLSFIMLDIDYFKYYNDNHGHPQGDQILRMLSGLLQQNTRDVDTVFRYGGEEFSVIIPEVAKQEAYSMAERIRRVIQDHLFPYDEEQPGGNLTVSMGVASLPEDALSGDELIDKADRALYRAKQTGRNRVCLYSTDLDASVVQGQGRFPDMEADHQAGVDTSTDYLAWQDESERESGN